MRENAYQAHIIRRLNETFPQCVILKNDPTYKQGIPDLLVLHRNKWAALEIKADMLAAKQPNQDYWVNALDAMSMATFVFPQNEDAIFTELQRYFRRTRKPPITTAV